MRSPTEDWIRLVRPDSGAGGGVRVVASDGGESAAGPWKRREVNEVDRGLDKICKRGWDGHNSLE